MNITLFGGAFDPPHLGHLQIIISLFEQNLADEVWLVPTGVHDFDKKMSCAETRVKLLELIMNHLPEKYQSKVKIEKCELEREGVSQTAETLEELAEKHPQDRFSWVLGSDNLEKFHLWDGYQKILSNYLVYVYPRQNYPMRPLYTGMIPLTGVRKVKASSTEVKKRLKINQSVMDLLPKSILDYIVEHKLYL
ncbi:MAG: putative nicotinate-nucleotide adenylyltransferase [Microgenomates bacterium 39_7]|nr:MAG: putative nicotinate-nucleotide adenylyltransferase [Microgenomates bacterium 39_7]